MDEQLLGDIRKTLHEAYKCGDWKSILEVIETIDEYIDIDPTMLDDE